MRYELTPLQDRVFKLFTKPGVDIPIKDLYDAAYPIPNGSWKQYGDTRDYPSVRFMQMALGPLFSRINTKLRRGRIEPGKLKQTYRLAFKQKE